MIFSKETKDRMMKEKLVVTVVCVVLTVLSSTPVFPAPASDDTVIVSAEGLVDPNADMYAHDRGIMIDDLRNDAKRQALEKVVGIYVDSTTLVQNYMLVHDRVLTQSHGLIKKIIKESEPWLGKDGFMHMLIKAEIFKGNTRDVLKALSDKNRRLKLREAGNPRISVAITVKDAERDSGTVVQRSEVAENVFKKQVSQFGYRVWSEEVADELNQGMEKRSSAKGDKDLAAFYANRQLADFKVVGSVKFQPLVITMKASGLKVKKYALNAWTVKCYDTQTGEELYFNNKIPQGKSWLSEDLALQDIGKMISDEFSTDFFAGHLASNVGTYQLMIEGLPSYDTGLLFKKELIGLRPVLNVDFRSFDLGGVALYEVEFTGDRSHFSQTVNSAVIKPLNIKFGQERFQLTAMQGKVLRLRFNRAKDTAAVTAEFEKLPPSSLTTASKERLQALAQSRTGRESINTITTPLGTGAPHDLPPGASSETHSTIGDF